MDENPGLSDQYRKASPWPLFVAVGLPVAEMGILFGVFPVAVGGLLLFCGSIAGLLRESGYVETPWSALVVMAGLLFAFGGYLLYANPLTQVDVVTRGYAVLAAGVVLLAGAVAGRVFVREDAGVPA